MAATERHAPSTMRYVRFNAETGYARIALRAPSGAIAVPKTFATSLLFADIVEAQGRRSPEEMNAVPLQRARLRTMNSTPSTTRLTH